MTSKKALAYLLYGKPAQWVEYETLSYRAVRDGDEYNMTEMIKLIDKGWVRGREKRFSNLAEIDSLMAEKFVRSTKTDKLVSSQSEIWYHLKAEETGLDKAQTGKGECP